MRGQAKSLVNLKVKRYGVSDTLKFSFERAKVKIKSVPYYGMVSDKVGYFILTSFTESASTEILAAMKELKKQGAEKFIFDLRNCLLLLKTHFTFKPLLTLL